MNTIEIDNCTKTENYFRKPEIFKLFQCSLAIILYVYIIHVHHMLYLWTPVNLAALTAVPLSEAVTCLQKAEVNIANGAEDVRSALCLCFS